MIADIVLELVGGIALFIYGIHLASDGIQKAASENLRKFLEKATSNPIIGVFIGFLVTAVIQSSSATTVMVISLVNSGMMTLPQAVGVIFGANIGTTVTAQIIALKITKYGIPFFALGFLLYFLPFKRKIKYLGLSIMGFGLIFIGIEIMAGSVEPLKHSQAVRELFVKFGKIPILGVLASAVFTAIEQSSSVSIGIVQALAMKGLLDISSAFPLVIGANIGTTVTAMIASIGTTVSAKRAAVSHLIFNIVGAAIFLIILHPYINFIRSLGGDTVRQIANSHTLFNIINTLIFLPFIKLFVDLVKKLVPGKEIVVETGVQYLTKSMLKSPLLAFDSLRKETERLSEIVYKNLIALKEMIFTKNKKIIKEIETRENTINFINREISKYVPLIAALDLPEREAFLVPQMLIISSQLERIGDIIFNTSQIELHRLEDHIAYSQYAYKELSRMCDTICESYELIMKNLFNLNDEVYKKIKENEELIDELEEIMREHHIDRLNKGICSSEAGIVYLDVVSNLERIGDHIMKIANIVYSSKIML